MSTRVQDVLNEKHREVVTTVAQATVYDAVAMMAEHEIGALVVMEGRQVCGIVTERDYARKVLLQGKDARKALVAEIMTPRVICVAEDQSVENCMALMTQKRLRHLPVLEGTNLVGIVSIGDMVKAAIVDQEGIIGELERYIAGAR